MCGRYGFTKPEKIFDRFGVETYGKDLDLKPRYNVAPSQDMPIVVRHSPNSIDIMRWGLIPFWAKDPKIGNSLINARADGIEKKPAFRKPFKLQRCIVPADGFYEWKETGEGKVPYYFKMKDDSLFGFAGLYDVWRDTRTGKEIKSYTIITTEPNEIVGKVHNRMPVILEKEEENTWLNPDETEPDNLLPLLDPFPSEPIESYEVSKFVNNPRNDSPTLIESQ